VSAWREAPYFTDAERAALALAEAATRLDDNRLNVTTRQIAGAAW
jgi:alkylhydroperoxidase family enzyme